MASSLQTTLTISMPLSDWTKNEDSKKAREKHINNIMHHVCALLNSNGGTLVLKATKDENITTTDTNDLRFEDVIRKVEQKLNSIIRTARVNSHLSSKVETPTEIVMKVGELKTLCTLSYNMFLPTDTQVSLIESDEVTVTNLIVNDRIIDVTDFEKAQTFDRFVLNSHLGIRESKTVQFKCLKSEKSKHNDLASRIIRNKFTSYVSAFANHIGGRIYIGIDENGLVVGETITKAMQKNLEKKLQKHIDKMLWPEYCSPPVKGKQWDIEFHAVIDSDDCPVQPRISEHEVRVIVVITIYACQGGVFAEKPESYHIVEVDNEGPDGLEIKVEPMDFKEWKTRLLFPGQKRNIPRTLSKCDGSSHKRRQQCDALDGKLLKRINNGEWEAFEQEAEKYQPKPNDPDGVEVELVILSKRYVYLYRKGDFESADKLMEEFNEKFSQSKDSEIFEIRGLLCLSARQRSEGQHKKSYETARNCFSKVEKLSPCILSAEYYVHFATMLTIIEGNETLKEEFKGDLNKDSFKKEAMMFYDIALQHLEQIHHVPLSKADMQQKSHINMAILKLGCSLSGDVVDDIVSMEAIKAASTDLDCVYKSIVGGVHPLSDFRSYQYKFATSSYLYRYSQHERQIDERTRLLEDAIRDVKKDITKKEDELPKFPELAKYARKHALVYREELEQLQPKNED